MNDPPLRSSQVELHEAARRVEVEPSVVEPLALADREQVERVGVVRDEDDARLDRLSVDRDADTVAMRDERAERPQPGKRVAPPAVVLATVDELRVDAERDVVQEEAVVRAADVDPELVAVDERVEGRDRIVAVEPEVACEMVARPERDTGERHAALERRLGDHGERPVPAGHRQRLARRRACELGEVVTVAEDVRPDPALVRFLEQLLRAAVAGAGVDDQECIHRASIPGLHDSQRWAERLMSPSDPEPIITRWIAALCT